MAIDLRSDTVTRPTAAMREAMMAAPVGDDVYGDDPTVNALEARMATVTGKAAALFVASGTQSNLAALLSHCQRGEEYIAGQEAHTYRFEAGGAAVLGGIQPQPLPFNTRGELDPDAVRAAVKPDDPHFAITRLLCLENTQGGKVLALSYLDTINKTAIDAGLLRHLDGARLFNAATALDVPPRQICDYFDSVSICFSKGLGCPVGSVLVGETDFIKRARRWRKMLGGGMRQAGVLAAACLHALDHHLPRLGDDHDRARRLGEAITRHPALTLAEPVQTNMVMLDISGQSLGRLRDALAARGIVISGSRLVIHQDVDDRGLEYLLEALAGFNG